MDFRALRFSISEDSYECIITNLPSDEFNAEEIKKLYAMRWESKLHLENLNMQLD